MTFQSLLAKAAREDVPPEDDQGVFAEATARARELTDALRQIMDRGDKKAKGSVAIVLTGEAVTAGRDKLVGWRVEVVTKLPSTAPRRTVTEFLHSDGSTSEMPEQQEMPLGGRLRAVGAKHGGVETSVSVPKKGSV